MDRGAWPLGPWQGAGRGQTSLLQASRLSSVQQTNLPGPPLLPTPRACPTPRPGGNPSGEGRETSEGGSVLPWPTLHLLTVDGTAHESPGTKLGSMVRER